MIFLLSSQYRQKVLSYHFSWDVAAGAIGDEYMLVYFGQSRPSFKILPLPIGNQYKIELIDTWEMTITPLPLEGNYSDTSRIELPGKQYMGLRITKK
jgi:hypothetical protein